jgi:two-component system NtrC family sensor kinase
MGRLLIRPAAQKGRKNFFFFNNFKKNNSLFIIQIPMKNIFKHPRQSLAAKLIIAIGILMVMGSFIFWFATLQKQEKDIMSIALKYGNSFNDFIKKSTRYSMLTFRRSAIQQTLEDISIAEGVERVRIFDHYNGLIYYSSNKEDVNTYVNRNSLSCKGCHIDTHKTVAVLPEQKKSELYKSSEGFTRLKLIEPIFNEPACYTSECHIHSEDQKILGLVEANISLALLDKAKFKQGLALTTYVIIFILAISIFLGIILYKIVSKPISKLTRGIEKVASGNFDHSVPITSEDEMGVLASRFNAMIKDLKEAHDQRELWTQTLETEIARKTDEIQKTHSSMLHTEKLASLGRMAAGIAHEINNPLTGIVTFAHLMRNNAPPDSSEAEDLNVIIEQAERCAKIIKNLLTFARATPSEKGEANINDVLSRSIYMIKNQAKFHNIKFNIHMEEAQFITFGDASQFQQIFLNMLINAADAMNERGTVTIVTRGISVHDKPYVEIEFTDTGMGIKEEDMPKLFEPFYTTKPVDKGTGLGLSVSHGIVKHCGGEIDIKSTVGKGTSFFVRLPLIEQKS